MQAQSGLMSAIMIIMAAVTLVMFSQLLEDIH
jgi:hypothetical protein